MAQGVAALGSSYVVVGLHTGEIVMFRVCYEEGGYQCHYLARYRQHLRNITDLASSITDIGSVLASGDITGDINIWGLEEGDAGDERLVHRSKIGDWSGHSVTTLAVWNKYKEVRDVPQYHSKVLILALSAGGPHSRLRERSHPAVQSGWREHHLSDLSSQRMDHWDGPRQSKRPSSFMR